ncbi:bifunctional 3,4-dihydroxy-2-butanone-4-phosphate synthase/GTP cyclohydrolase II [Asaia bogorensis]|uniref:Multifunctional fusion protein n=1 Tax=Asaia bogorensis NBRC 16594 TaxID=1231624 RepID=A0AAN4U2C7_9PROT|nr:bifunctional 3,4-dihydroxy-2-butanone-4-phosphate synthase/GTP cyclohydrolase II [Asaia bogorensis]BAT18774.1 bifunctional 3,4-dihydroxy-2-butanone 4-phosphate synthase/GTP cyclohydrolase II [Asaia bogorensis NBRC 16594]GBQ77149.1 3,4-dihydroxy-2-butanone 4-phosphate synthase [Asaia bogorensis NBRC 16594]GEL53128.1 GTP cyclohydrolase-2 [Asaia bogorensis NBRC 16594]
MNTLPSPGLAYAITALREGRMVMMVDDEARENEGDLVIAAQFATPDAVNFMATHARGLICLPLEPEQIERLELPMMPRRGHDPRGTAFTVSIEATTGITTGISAADRARTIQVAGHPDARPEDISTPGHIFPLRAHPEGTVARDGHTEGAVDLARLAGLFPAAVICEVMSDDGTMARLPELRAFSARHDIPVISIEEIAAWCRVHGREALGDVILPAPVPPAVERIAEAALPSVYGGHDLRIQAFRAPDGIEHVALIKGDPANGTPLVRLHSECVTGDALGSLRCDCGPQLREALERIAAAPSGVLVYLRGHEGRGIGLGNKIRAYALQDAGKDTLEANLVLGLPGDARDWVTGAAILQSLGIDTLRLLTNNPSKVSGLEAAGLKVISQERLEAGSNPFNRAYLHAKRTRMGHQLSDVWPELVDSVIQK